MSIDWLLTKLGGTKPSNDVTQSNDEVNNCERATDAQHEKIGQHTKNIDIPDQHSNENPERNSKK